MVNPQTVQSKELSAMNAGLQYIFDIMEILKRATEYSINNDFERWLECLMAVMRSSCIHIGDENMKGFNKSIKDLTPLLRGRSKINKRKLKEKLHNLDIGIRMELKDVLKNIKDDPMTAALRRG